MKKGRQDRIAETLTHGEGGEGYFLLYFVLYVTVNR
jgi:hypothetical protein